MITTWGNRVVASVIVGNGNSDPSSKPVCILHNAYTIRKAMNLTIIIQLWVNSGTDWAYLPWYGKLLYRGKEEIHSEIKS